MSTVEMLRELEAKATPGPWRGVMRMVEIEDEARPDICTCNTAFFDQWRNDTKWDRPDTEAIANAALIAAMRNAMPALLRVADAAKARFEVWTPETYQELKEALEALEEAHNE